jgi:Flp pilus assembly protein protease CpaA
MIEISATCVVWLLFGVMCFCTSFCVAILAQFGGDEKKTLTVSTVFASACTALYFLFISGILKIVN